MLRRGEWGLEEETRGMIGYDKACLGVMSISSLLFYDMSQTSLVDDTPGEGIYDSRVTFGGSVFRYLRELRGSFSLHLLFFSSTYNSEQSIWQSGVCSIFCHPSKAKKRNSHKQQKRVEEENNIYILLKTLQLTGTIS